MDARFGEMLDTSLEERACKVSAPGRAARELSRARASGNCVPRPPLTKWRSSSWAGSTAGTSPTACPATSRVAVAESDELDVALRFAAAPIADIPVGLGPDRCRAV